MRLLLLALSMLCCYSSKGASGPDTARLGFDFGSPALSPAASRQIDSLIGAGFFRNTGSIRIIGFAEYVA